LSGTQNSISWFRVVVQLTMIVAPSPDAYPAPALQWDIQNMNNNSSPSALAGVYRILSIWSTIFLQCKKFFTQGNLTGTTFPKTLVRIVLHLETGSRKCAGSMRRLNASDWILHDQHTGGCQMTSRITRFGALVSLLVAFFAIAGGVSATEIPPEPAAVINADDSRHEASAITNSRSRDMSTARHARFTGTAEVARGDECPIGSGAYCSDSSPYCFMCRGEYACCWSREVWRCCD
jgi:hypothetical protein